MRKTPFKPVLSFLLFLCLKILFIEMGVAQNTTFIPVNVGVALDLGSDLDGKIALSCINMAVSDFYANHGDYKTRMVLTTRDSKKDVVGSQSGTVASAFCTPHHRIGLLCTFKRGICIWRSSDFRALSKYREKHF
ncbi:hypothetical protein DKX38_027691 [Salix brachista]|uniref:Receptor ligand binding region domain-containing protein n=1 Tax=Salix brachista TaxID=2182728 RepID=A0A5N5J8I0_9ROSI|nr:hypothetical protein DKX38_027691 [Salix brachista]